MVFEALGLVLLGRWRRLDLHIGVAGAEHVGRHDGCAGGISDFDRLLEFESCSVAI